MRLSTPLLLLLLLLVFVEVLIKAPVDALTLVIWEKAASVVVVAVP